MDVCACIVVVVVVVSMRRVVQRLECTAIPGIICVIAIIIQVTMNRTHCHSIVCFLVQLSKDNDIDNDGTL